MDKKRQKNGIFAHLPSFMRKGKSTATAPAFDGHPSDVIIPIMGPTGVGKSTFINTIFGDNNAVVGHGLQSETAELKPFVMQINIFSDQYKGNDGRLILVDTPGFDDTFADDAEILERISLWLANSYQKGVKLGGVIYLHDITQTRMLGTTRRNLEMFRKLVGQEALCSVVLGTTKWNLVTSEVGLDRQKQLEDQFWQEMIKAGSKVVKVDSDNAPHKLVQEILQRLGKNPVLGQNNSDTFQKNVSLSQNDQKDHNVPRSDDSITQGAINPSQNDHTASQTDRITSQNDHNAPQNDCTASQDHAEAKNDHTASQNNRTTSQNDQNAFQNDSAASQNDHISSQNGPAAIQEDYTAFLDIYSEIHTASQNDDTASRNDPAIIEHLQIQNEIVNMRRFIPQTEAGQTLKYSLEKLITMHKNRVRRLKEQTLGSQDSELMEEFQKAQEELTILLATASRLKVPITTRLKKYLFGGLPYSNL